jgi:hypothetical protein
MQRDIDKFQIRFAPKDVNFLMTCMFKKNSGPRSAKSERANFGGERAKPPGAEPTRDESK